MLSKLAGPALIGLAALLWATDAPFRYSLAFRLDPTVIVFYEHLLVCAALAVWVLFSARKKVLKLSAFELLLAGLIGAGGSALATILFTASFALVNPTVAILLQKLQPVFVLTIAQVCLGERPERRVYLWGGFALAAAAVLSVPDFHPHWGSAASRGMIDALAAAAIWAASTVAGKRLLRRHSPAVVTFWRYLFGLAMLTGILLATSGRQATAALLHPSAGVALRLAYMSYVVGLLAMVLYYRGLARTAASVATLVELVYPISAVLLNAWLLQQTLSGLQIGAAALLLFCVAQITR